MLCRIRRCLEQKKIWLYVYNPSFTECIFAKQFNSKRDIIKYMLNQDFSNIQLFSFREENTNE